MDRQTILASIHQQLRADYVETGEVRPLGEVVPRVAGQLRRGMETVDRLPTIVPIPWVAAFVDGELSPLEAKSVCDAVLSDNSVLAELIAAIRAKQEDSATLPPLSAELSKRIELLAAERKAAEGSGVQPVYSATRIDTTPQPRPNMRIDDPIHSVVQQPRRRPYRRETALLLTMAAMLLLVTYFGISPLFEMDSQNSASAPMVVPESTNTDDEVQSIAPEIAADAVELHASSLLVENVAAPARSSNPRDGTEESAGQPLSTAMAPVAVETPSPSRIAPPQNIPNTIGPDAAHQLAGFHWTSISGVVAQQSIRPEDLDYPDRVVWSGTATGSESFSGDEMTVHLRTLPACRAVAEIVSGGAIVLAADTGVHIRRGSEHLSAEIDIEHGALALKDLPQNTLIRLNSPGKSTIELGWHSNASVIIGFSPEGLQAWVLEGTIAFNEQPVEKTALLISDSGDTTRVDAPHRLPEWFERESDAIGIPKHILGQLANSPNLAADLNQGIVELVQSASGSAIDNRNMQLLATWQIALFDTQLYRFAGNRIPAIRQAALLRLVELPEWEPRYKTVWQGVERSMREQRRIAQITRLCLLARRGGRLSHDQLDMLLAGLDSDDVAGRALSDYLLRRFYTGGPAFDPVWGGKNRVRAIAAWRRFTGRSAQ